MECYSKPPPMEFKLSGQAPPPSRTPKPTSIQEQLLLYLVENSVLRCLKCRNDLPKAAFFVTEGFYCPPCFSKAQQQPVSHCVVDMGQLMGGETVQQLKQFAILRNLAHESEGGDDTQGVNSRERLQWERMRAAESAEQEKRRAERRRWWMPPEPLSKMEELREQKERKLHEREVCNQLIAQMNQLCKSISHTILGYSAHPCSQEVLQLAAIDSYFSNKIENSVRQAMSNYSRENQPINYTIETFIVEPQEIEKREKIQQKVDQMQSMSEQMKYITSRTQDLLRHVDRLRSGKEKSSPFPEKDAEESADSLFCPTPFAKKIKPISKGEQPRKRGRPQKITH